MRFFAIGDIHGCLTALQRLDQEIQFCADDTVVTLGDYVDRGPDSCGVIDYLISLRSRCHLVTLRGNHEIMMMRAKEDRSVLFDWLACGGHETLTSYSSDSFAGIPQSHWDFLDETIRFHEEAHDFYVHANAYPDFALSDQPDYMLFWERFGDPSPHFSGRRMICGHSAQRNGRPLDVGHSLCIDTWAHGGGWLTCLDVRSGIYWQANQQGSLRMDRLD